MKLAIARGLFLVSALGVASFAAAAWQEPETQVVVSVPAEGHPLKPHVGDRGPQVRPDKDLLLFIFSLSQSMSAAN